LKSPFHLSRLDALLDVFPDACVVHTHRDPARAVPSTIDLFEQGRVATTARPRRTSMIDFTAWMCHESMQRALQTRRDLGDDRFFDVRFSDLMRDPAAIVRAIYERFDLDMAPGFDSALDDATRRSQARHVAKRYDPSDFGFEAEVLREAFSDYRRRFGVPDEG
jgi:hypothetical protein